MIERRALLLSVPAAWLAAVFGRSKPASSGPPGLYGRSIAEMAEPDQREYTRLVQGRLDRLGSREGLEDIIYDLSPPDDSPFVLLEELDRIREARTGITRYNTGLGTIRVGTLSELARDRLRRGW